MLNHPLFFSSGLKRSGSTWSYNAARLLLQACHENIHAGYIGEGDNIDRFFRTAQIDRPTLLKFHYPSQTAFQLVHQGLAKNVYTVRHPLNALASELEFFDHQDFETALNNIIAGLQMMDRWKGIEGTLFIDFDDLTSNPASEIRKIAEHFQLVINDEVIDRIDEETSFESSKQTSEEMKGWTDNRLIRSGKLTYDPVTLLHIDGHATKGPARRWQDTLSEEQTDIAERKLSAWLTGFS